MSSSVMEERSIWRQLLNLLSFNIKSSNLFGFCLSLSTMAGYKFYLLFYKNKLMLCLWSLFLSSWCSYRQHKMQLAQMQWAGFWPQSSLCRDSACLHEEMLLKDQTALVTWAFTMVQQFYRLGRSQGICQLKVQRQTLCYPHLSCQPCQ